MLAKYHEPLVNSRLLAKYSMKLWTDLNKTFKKYNHRMHKWLMDLVLENIKKKKKSP